MGVMNNRVWKKSYMLEFLSAGAVTDAFTFSVPPESEEISFPNRVSETKTFTGSVFESYGNDTIRIMLSGSTVNDELKLIYRGLTLPPYYLSGENEIFKLQSIIEKYNTRPQDGVASLVGETKIYLYDLSKMNALQLTTGVGRNYWEVYIKELKIKRDKSRPLAYSYTLDMLGIPGTTTESNIGLSSSVVDVISGIETAIDTAQTVSEYTQGVVDLTEDILSDTVKAKRAFEAKSDPSLLTVAMSIDSGVRILTGTSGNTFYSCAKDVLAMSQELNEIFNGNANEGKIYTSKDTSTYTISFETNGAGYIKSQSLKYGDKVTEPGSLEKENSEFSGWYTDEELTNEYDFSLPVTQDFTLYAKWTLIKAQVTFISNGGSSIESQIVNIGECAVKPEDPTREGYLFVEWCTDSEYLREEYDFSLPVTKDFTLYAKWESAYTVTFISEGETIETQTIAKGGYAVYPLTPTKEGYTFLGWYKDEALTNPFDFSDPIEEDTILYASYIHTYSTVTFDSMGGTEVESQKVYVGEHAITPSNPTKEGYTFRYWSLEENGSSFDFNKNTIENDITLYAQWSQASCTVKFDSDGGTEYSNSTVLYGEKVVFPGRPEKEGYLFDVWQIENEEGEMEEYDFSLPVTKNFTLYATYVKSGSSSSSNKDSTNDDDDNTDNTENEPQDDSETKGGEP